MRQKRKRNFRSQKAESRWASHICLSRNSQQEGSPGPSTTEQKVEGLEVPGAHESGGMHGLKTGLIDNLYRTYFYIQVIFPTLYSQTKTSW